MPPQPAARSRAIGRGGSRPRRRRHLWHRVAGDHAGPFFSVRGHIEARCIGRLTRPSVRTAPGRVHSRIGNRYPVYSATTSRYQRGRFGEIRYGPRPGQVYMPTRQLAVDGPDAVEHRLVIRDVLVKGRPRPGKRHRPYGIEGGENIELGDRDLRERVQPHSVTEQDQVQPSGRRRRPVFVPYSCPRSTSMSPSSPPPRWAWVPNQPGSRKPWRYPEPGRCPTARSPCPHKRRRRSDWRT